MGDWLSRIKAFGSLGFRMGRYGDRVQPWKVVTLMLSLEPLEDASNLFAWDLLF
jgi:hypothetical protein